MSNHKSRGIFHSKERKYGWGKEQLGTWDKNKKIRALPPFALVSWASARSNRNSFWLQNRSTGDQKLKNEGQRMWVPPKWFFWLGIHILRVEREEKGRAWGISPGLLSAYFGVFLPVYSTCWLFDPTCLFHDWQLVSPAGSSLPEWEHE